MLRLGILGSTRGTAMDALIAAVKQKALAAEITIVLSNNREAPILERARKFGFLAEFVDPNNLSREAFDDIISNYFQKHRVELIVLIGYMRILSKKFVASWPQQIINVHPSLLPAYAGKISDQVHQAVLAAKETESGCTVHFVTEEVDAGPILVQKKCRVRADDTIESLKTRVQEFEGPAIIEAIHKVKEMVHS